MTACSHPDARPWGEGWRDLDGRTWLVCPDCNEQFPTPEAAAHLTGWMEGNLQIHLVHAHQLTPTDALYATDLDAVHRDAHLAPNDAAKRRI